MGSKDVQAAHSGEFDLSVVVPVHNAASTLDPLVSSILSLKDGGLSVQVILVDDGSTDASEARAQELAAAHDEIFFLSNGVNLGAGVARNLGWAHVAGRYTLFFDADDILHPEVIAPTITNLDREHDVDVAVFAYSYERDAGRTNLSMSRDDESILKGYLEGASENVGALYRWADLLVFTNYPWNKIIRTAQYRGTGMAFGKTKVHNDILGHWTTFLLARQIMLVDKMICTHIVHASGANLTNRFTEERFQVFDALAETYDFLESRPGDRQRYSHYFWTLTTQIMGWAGPKMAGDLKQELESRYVEFLGRMRLDDFARLRTKRNPRAAKLLARRLLY